MSTPDENYGLLSVPQLKTLLRERNGSLKGKKKDLIDRLMFYDQNDNFSSKPTSFVLNSNYDRPAEMITPDLNFYRDINADSDLPTLTMSNIQNYLDRFTIGVDSGRKMYENHFILSVQMAITSTGIVENCQCDCAVGEPPNADCKHVVALLLALEQMKRECKITLYSTCTQVLQDFHKPKKMYFGSPVKAEDLPHNQHHSINFRPILHKIDATKYRERVRNLCIGYLSRSSSTMPFKQTIHPANIYAVVSDHDYSINAEKEVLKGLKLFDITDEEQMISRNRRVDPRAK